MKVSDFTDERIAKVYSGEQPLSGDERYFLIHDTLTFEECDFSDTELATMDDAELMRSTYGVWAEYASCL